VSEVRSIVTLMDRVLGGRFSGPSWAAWRVLLKAIFALPLSKVELETFARLTGRDSAPTAVSREVWAVVGRRGGKSVVAALVAVFLTTCRSYDLAPGERGVFMVIAADRRQARVVRRYIGGLLHSTPVLEQMIAHETKTEIQLANGINIEIHTANFRSVRGYTLVGAVLDELAFWPVEDSASPDREILTALRPAMATVPGAMMISLSSPYARRGELWKAHERHYGKDGDVLVIRATTQQLNPTVPQEIIERAFEEDSTSAWSEYGRDGEIRFRSDVESFVNLDAVQACVVPGRLELPPVQDVRYEAFADPSGGSSDSFTLAIGHTEDNGHPVAVVDAIRERRPPFSPEAVVEEYASLLKSYGIRSVVGDRYAGEWPREAFQRHGITYEPSAKPKSDLYRNALPLLNAGRIELLDDDRLVAQIVGLERRTARGGRDSIDHAPNQHDDLANVVAGLAVSLAINRAKQVSAVWGRSTSSVRSKSESEMTPRDVMRSRLAFARHIDLQQREAPIPISTPTGTKPIPKTDEPVTPRPHRGRRESDFITGR